MCLDKCPSGTRLDGKQCVKKCASGIYKRDGDTKICISECGTYHVSVSESEIECVTTCPENEPNANSGECVDSCASGTVTVNLQAQQKFYCGSEPCKYFFAKQAVGDVTNMICYDSCPDDHLKKYGKECLASCEDSQFIYGDFCYDNCPAPLRNSGDKSCSDNCTYF